MATDPAVVERICALADPERPLRARKMFGEYGLYLDDRLVALVCDDRLFVKPTAAGRAVLAASTVAIAESPPYPGAKPHLVVATGVQHRELLQRLFDATAEAVPKPKRKAPGRAG